MTWLTLALLLTFQSAAYAGGEWNFKLVPRPPSKAVKGLEFDQKESEIRDSGEITPYELSLVARFNDEDHSLLVNGEKVPTGPSGEFHFKLPIRRADEQVVFASIGLDGSVTTSTYALEIPDWAALQADLLSYRRKQFFGFGTLGLTTVSLQDPAAGQLSETALTLRAGATYRFRRKPMELSTSAYFTGIPLALGQDATVRLFGLEARAGYHAPWLEEPWDLLLGIGVHYATVFSSPDGLGYRDAFGPQFQPTLSYAFPGGNTARVYLRLAPFGTAVQFSTWEVAFGAAYSFADASGRGMILTLDNSQVNTTTRAGSCSLTAFTIGAGYGF